MNTKQILLIGGGTALGAFAAVAIMKALPSEAGEAAKRELVEAPKIPAVDSRLPSMDSGLDAKSEFRNNVSSLVEEIDRESTIDPDELESRREEFEDAMKERQMTRLTDKMAKWGAALGLDEGQKEKLVEISGAQIEELETLAAAAEGDDPAAMSTAAKRAMAIMSGRALEESMAEILTPEQKTRYDEFGARQNASRAEARALRQIATLQEDLMLTNEQRNDVYGLVYDDALKQVEGDSDVTSMIEQFTSESGVSLDPSVQGMISSLANRGLEELASGEDLDADSIGAIAESAMGDSIEQQVDLLRPVLTDAQLDLYRSQLEGRIGGLMRMGLGGPSSGDSGGNP